MTDEQQAQAWYERWQERMFPDGGGRTWRELPLESKDGYLWAARIQRNTAKRCAEIVADTDHQYCGSLYTREDDSRATLAEAVQNIRREFGLEAMARARGEVCWCCFGDAGEQHTCFDQDAEVER